MLRLLLCLLAPTMFSSQPAIAQSNGLLVLSGQCTKLIVAGSNRTKICRGEVGSETYKDGTIVFTFRANGMLLAFAGVGQGLKPGKNATLTVVFVGAQFDGTEKVLKPFRAPARGTCRFTDPWTGKPSTLTCSAKTAVESFTASFRSNGQPPVQR
jgi:hypothetical protein